MEKILFTKLTLTPECQNMFGWSKLWQYCTFVPPFSDDEFNAYY